MNYGLSQPDEELARRILATVPYSDRLPVGRLSPHLGITRGSVRGLPGLHLYFTPDARTLPGINLNKLADWIERVIIDAEFAEEVRNVSRTAESYVDGCMKVYEIVELRLNQAKEVAGHDLGNIPVTEGS
jgi:hypothetical protein